MKKKIIQKILKYYAKKIIAKHKPKVVAITGSVGKTTTKEFVYSVLSAKFNSRRNLKNFNNEIGVPLTIIGAENPSFSFLGWLKIFQKAREVLRGDKFAEVLVLEMGVDRPGDMDYLLSIVKPNISIITNIGDSHLEFFKTRENILKEKGKIVKNLNKNSLAILNYDDKLCLSLKKETKARVLTFGFEEGADFCAQDFEFHNLDLNFVLKGKEEKITIKNAVNKKIIYDVLPALALGEYFKIPLKKQKEKIKQTQIPEGRIKLLDNGKYKIIDDTYNASPQSVLSLLSSILENKSFAQNRKILVLGDMLELGEFSKKAHQQIGDFIAKNNFNALFACGEQVKYIAEQAKKGLDDVFYFKNKNELIENLKKFAKNNDLIIIKASHGMHFEEISKKLLNF